MDTLIAAFPENIYSALESAKTIRFKNPENEIRNIVFIGMGGSGIGAKIVAEWIEDKVHVPTDLLQDYTLPKFVNKHTLVIASSYSGNTEETIATLLLAKEAGAHIIGICSGGSLQQICAENSYDCVVVPGGNPPRTATAYSITHIINCLINLGLIETSVLKTLENAVSVITSNIEEIKEEANKLAAYLNGKTPMFYSSTEYEPIIIRARQQFNENSKVLCIHHVIPEMNHNELVGWGGGNDSYAPVFFDTKDMNIQNTKRFELTMEVIGKKTSNKLVINSKGANKIERSLYLIHLIDWASLYLANLNGTDPIEIDCINYLKTELSKL